MRTKYLILIYLLCGSFVFAQTVIDVNLDVKHKLGNITQFDRNKFVTIHADITENDWNGTNESPNLINDVLINHDVYLGRNSGGITWQIKNNITEDRNRSGFADSLSVRTNGRSTISSYAKKTSIHKYEPYNDQVLVAQLHPFWPDGETTNKGWAFSQTDTDTEPFGTASGEYIAHYISNFYGNGGTTGLPKPKYLEVINEPVWHLTDYGTTDPALIFKYHNTVIDEVKKRHPEIAVGGYCTAFPDHDKDEFQEWEQRWKLYMDIAGEKTDYWAIHLYDFPSIGGKTMYRKGSNMEATFDMMEQYSYLQFGKVKPFMISEFGAQMHDYNKVWSPYRDWLHVKSSNAMMMQFMERANIVNKTINFIPLKAEWGMSGDVVYNHRLLRKANEPESYIGSWVYSDMMKIYELWKDVKGTRVESFANDLDIMVDAYVDGTKAYVVITNLEFEDKELNLNLLGVDNVVSEAKLSHLYLKGNEPVIDVQNYQRVPRVFTIGAEGSIVLECTYSTNLTQDELCEEVKYYATDYYKDIVANQAELFSIPNVQLGTQGEAILRLGIGRNHGLSLMPTVLVNGTQVEVPTDFRGGTQDQRDNFYGVIEVPVPYALLTGNNEISVTFSDNGGKISSVTMQVFNFSREIERSEIQLLEIAITPSTKQIKVGKSFMLDASAVPSVFQNEVGIEWSSDNSEIVSIDQTGKITSHMLGQATIYAKDTVTGIEGFCLVEVSNDGEAVIATSLELEDYGKTITNPGTLQIYGTFQPMDVDDTTLTWSSSNERVATVDQNGLVTSVSKGTVEISATTNDGSALSDKIRVTVPKFTSTVSCPTLKSSYGTNKNYTFDVPYVVGDDKDILVSINALNSINPMVEGRKTVSEGSSTEKIEIVLNDNLTEGTYTLWTRLVPVGGSWYSATSSCSQSFVVDKVNGVNKVVQATTYIHPNPATQFVNVNTKYTADYRYQIISLGGKVLMDGVVIQDGLIDITSLQKGMYLMHLVSDKENITLNLIKRY